MNAAMIVMSLLVAFALGCHPTKQARSMETTGFLGDLYASMHKGGEGEALLVYRNPKISSIPHGTYKKLLLDHVQVWGLPTTDPTRQRQAQKVADLLYTLAYLNLSKDYEMVSEPGPGTLHIQAAITKADPSHIVLRAVSTIPAPMNAFAVASLVKDLGTGKPLFVGEASIELKVSDSQSREVLAAFADRRVGTRHLDSDSFDSWDDVHKTLDYWAQLSRLRFCEARGDKNCVEPKE